MVGNSRQMRLPLNFGAPLGVCFWQSFGTATDNGRTANKQANAQDSLLARLWNSLGNALARFARALAHAWHMLGNV